MSELNELRELNEIDRDREALDDFASQLFGQASKIVRAAARKKINPDDTFTCRWCGAENKIRDLRTNGSNVLCTCDVWSRV